MCSNNLKVSFITICYNGLADTCELIESLKKNIHSVSYEIIVVDNASRQNEARILSERYPDIVTIRSEENTGFSGGNNLGIRQAKGEYIFLINNDTYIESDPLPVLIKRLESSTKIGAVAPKIRFAFPPREIQFAGYTELTPITLRNKAIGSGHADDGSFNQAIRTAYLHGAAFMLKREAIAKAGLMPEIYFLYYEELDWCTQIRRSGYELWYEPLATVFHKESQSTGQQSPLRTYYMTRNRLLYAWRNLSGANRCLSIVYQITVVASKDSLKYLLKRQLQLIGATWRGIVAFITLPNKKRTDL